MAQLSSKTALSGMIGDTFVDSDGTTYELVNVFSNGVYAWKELPASTGTGSTVPPGTQAGQQIIWDGSQWVPQMDTLGTRFPSYNEPNTYVTDLTTAGYPLVEGTYFWDADDNKIMIYDASGSWVAIEGYTGPTIQSGSQVGELLTWTGTEWGTSSAKQHNVLNKSINDTGAEQWINQWGPVAESEIYYNTTDKAIKYYDGSQWVALASQDYVDTNAGSGVPDGTFSSHSLVWNDSAGAWFVSAGQAAQIPAANNDSAGTFLHQQLQGNPLQGSLYYDYVNNVPKYYDGSAWQSLIGGSSGGSLFDGAQTLAATVQHDIGAHTFSMAGTGAFFIDMTDGNASPGARFQVSQGISALMYDNRVEAQPTSMIRADDSGVRMQFPTTGGLGIYDNAVNQYKQGTAGQALISNGPDTPPSWQDVSGGGANVLDGINWGDSLEWNGFDWQPAPGAEYQSVQVNGDGQANNAWTSAGYSSTNPIPGGATYWDTGSNSFKVRNPQTPGWDFVATLGSASNSQNGVLVIGDVAIQWGIAFTTSSLKQIDVNLQVAYKTTAYSIQVTAASSQVTEAMIGTYSDNQSNPVTTSRFTIAAGRHDVSPPSPTWQNNAELRWMTIGQIA